MPYSACCAQLLCFAWPIVRIVVAHADDGVAPYTPATTTEKHVKASGGERGKVLSRLFTKADMEFQLL